MVLNKVTKIAAIFWTIIIFIGCTLPGDGMPTLEHSDKVKHFLIFALWAFLWKKVTPLTNQPLFWIGTGYGFFIEICQLVLPINRDFEWLDLVADSVGIMAGLAVSVYMWPLLERYISPILEKK